MKMKWIMMAMLAGVVILFLIPRSFIMGQTYLGCDSPDYMDSYACNTSENSCAPSGCQTVSTSCDGGAYSLNYFQWEEFHAYGSCVYTPPIHFDEADLTVQCTKCQWFYCARGHGYSFLENGACIFPNYNCAWVNGKANSCNPVP